MTRVGSLVQLMKEGYGSELKQWMYRAGIPREHKW